METEQERQKQQNTATRRLSRGRRSSICVTTPSGQRREKVPTIEAPHPERSGSTRVVVMEQRLASVADYQEEMKREMKEWEDVERRHKHRIDNAMRKLSVRLEDTHARERERAEMLESMRHTAPRHRVNKAVDAYFKLHGPYQEKKERIIKQLETDNERKQTLIKVEERAIELIEPKIEEFEARHRAIEEKEKELLSAYTTQMSELRASRPRPPSDFPFLTDDYTNANPCRLAYTHA